MVYYFKSSFPAQFITIGIMGLLLWGTGAVNPPAMPPPEGPVPLYGLLYQWLSGYPYLAMAIGFILVAAQSVWLNYILSHHDLVPHNTSLSALLFLLFISLNPSFLTLTPINISTFFLLLILRAILEAYNQPEPTELVFTAGFFAAVSAFFYLPSLLFYGFLLISFVVYRTMNWREWIGSLIGLATPFLYLVVLYFLTDRLSALMTLYTGYFGHLHVEIPLISWREWILGGLLGIFIVLGLWDTLRHIGEKTVELRKKNIVLLWMFITTLVIIIYSNSLIIYHAGLLSIPLAVFVTNFYMHLRKPFWFGLLLWALLLFLFINTAFGHLMPSL